jgi:hypothetical protein
MDKIVLRNSCRQITLFSEDWSDALKLATGHTEKGVGRWEGKWMPRGQILKYGHYSGLTTLDYEPGWRPDGCTRVVESDESLKIADALESALADIPDHNAGELEEYTDDEVKADLARFDDNYCPADWGSGPEADARVLKEQQRLTEEERKVENQRIPFQAWSGSHKKLLRELIAFLREGEFTIGRELESLHE